MATKKTRLPEDCEPRCSRCEFFETEPGDDGGICIRFPRQLAVIMDEVYWIYPEMDDTDSCGEFKRKVN